MADEQQEPAPVAPVHEVRFTSPPPPETATAVMAPGVVNPKPAGPQRPLKAFRCLNSACATKRGTLGFDFHSTEGSPPCPKCGARADSRVPIVRLVMIHFDPPHGAESFPGKGHRACNPEIAIHAQTRRDGEPDTWHQGTGDMRAVNCPSCRDTEAFKAAVLAVEV